MNYVATITSKRQLTIPAEVFRTLNLAAGDKLIVEMTDDKQLKLQKTVDLVEKLAGSLSVPKKLAKVDLDKAISEAKQRRFGKKAL